MSHSRVQIRRTINLRSLKLAVALLTVLAMTACNSENSSLFNKVESGADTETGSDTGNSSDTENSTDNENNSDTENSTGNEDNLDTGIGSDVTDKFPSAALDSGPESLIVTGLDSTNPEATAPWLVNLDMFRQNSSLGTTGDLNVDLVKYDNDFPVSRHIEFYTVNLDTCEVNDLDATSTDSDNASGEGNAPSKVSGGSAVVINTPIGPWFTLNRTMVDGEVRYTVDNELPGELLPEDTTLSIPGDEFPTVASHPMFDPVSPDRLLPDETVPVTVNTPYTWIPAKGKNYMEINILAFDANNNFVDFAVICNVKDDGEFTMPTNVTNFVSTTPYKLEVRYTRHYHRLDFINGIVIRQRTSFAE